MENGSPCSWQMATRAQVGGGGVMASAILKNYPISLLVCFALNRVRIEEFQELAQPQQNFL